MSEPPTESRDPPDPTAEPSLPQATSKQIQPQSLISAHSRNAGRGARPEKRKMDLDGGSSAKRSSSVGLEPVKASSTKPWPVFTISGSAPTQTAKPAPKVDSPAAVRRPRRLQARTVIQQCSQARVKIKPALDGADAQWAEIGEGMVVYVCFFHGATEDITHEIADSLMSTRLFRKDTRHLVSILDLPGSVLFVPQDSLVGEPVPKRRMQYKGGCELWWGAQLFSNLVSACMELMSASVKCTEADVKVEQGVYGQKQEIVLNSMEPLTLLLEF
uniref:D-aminoacyl-tRNA deacylase 2-like n=1 Tax=Semicossyphus pulcher TaxID=241346 RepID=UPI0037E87F4C